MMDEAHYSALARRDIEYWWFKVRHSYVWRLVSELPPGSRNYLVDIGCGTGGFLAGLIEDGLMDANNVCGLDTHAGAVKVAQSRGVPARHVSGSLTQPPRLEFVPDVITMLDVLEHLSDPVDALQRIRGFIQPGGHLIVLVPALEILWSAWDERLNHYRRYSKRLLVAQLHQGGWEVVKIRYLFSSLFFPGLIRRYLLRTKSLSENDFPDVSRRMNRLLTAWFLAETRLPGLPFGTSLAAVARTAAPNAITA